MRGPIANEGIIIILLNESYFQGIKNAQINESLHKIQSWWKFMYFIGFGFGHRKLYPCCTVKYRTTFSYMQEIQYMRVLHLDLQMVYRTHVLNPGVVLWSTPPGDLA